MKYITICKNKYLNYTCLLWITTSVFILLYSLDTPQVSDFFKLFSSLILLQFLSFFCGSFFGFLFGFPSHNNNSFQDKYQRNSSLKEITNWLTKIIVGVTLIELKDIYIYLKDFIISLSLSFNNDSSHVLIIGAIIGIYFVLGFIVFYMLSVTSIFEELVVNDKNIENLLSEEVLNSNPVYHDELTINADLSKVLKKKDKEDILKYVSKNGVSKLEPLMAKRLGKFLFAIEEFDSAAKAYEVAYSKNPDDKFTLLNACYIRSKFLKDFTNSNKKLKQLIATNPEFAPAYYNLACSYNREYSEVKDKISHDKYSIHLKDKAIEYLKLAFGKDKGLYSEALTDSALIGMEIEKIFTDIKDEDKPN